MLFLQKKSIHKSRLRPPWFLNGQWTSQKSIRKADVSSMISSLYKLTAFLLILSVRPTYDQPDKEEELLDDPHGDRGSH